MESLRNLLENHTYIMWILVHHLDEGWCHTYVFNHLSEAIQWILVNKYGVHHLLHLYLNDFLTTGPPDLSICTYNLNSMLPLRVSVLLNHPRQKVHPLPIQLDTVAMEASIILEHKCCFISRVKPVVLVPLMQETETPLTHR